MSIVLPTDFTLDIDGACLEVVMAQLQAITNQILYVRNGEIKSWKTLEEVPLGGFVSGQTNEEPFYVECISLGDGEEMYVSSVDAIGKLCSLPN